MSTARFGRQALEIARKDLVIEGRAGEVLLVTIPFGAVVLILFPMAVGTNRPLLTEIGAGVFWAVVLIFGLLATLRQSGIDSGPQRDLLALLGVDPAAGFAGRSAATALLLLAFEAVLGPLTIVLYQPAGVNGWGWLLLTGLLFALGLSLLGTLAGSIAAGLRTRSTLVPLLVVPLAVPLLLGATQTVEALRLGRSILGWTLILVVMVLSIAVLGVLTARPLEEGSR
jgi:heme exporter protein B